MTSRIIGIHGKQQTGEDTLAAHLVAEHGFTRLAFADRLKHELCSQFDVSLVLFTCRSMKEERHEDLALCHCNDISFPAWYMDTPEAIAEMNAGIRLFTVPRTPRWIMQRYGDWRRSQYSHYFIDPVITALLEDKSFVVTDIRTEREALALHALTIIGKNYELWKIVRPGKEEVTHATDADILPSYIDHIIRNDSTVDDLKKHATLLLTRY